VENESPEFIIRLVFQILHLKLGLVAFNATNFNKFASLLLSLDNIF